MTMDSLWRVVEQAKSDAGSDIDSRVTSLESLLGQLSLAQIAEFQLSYDELIARAYRWDIWGAAYVMNGGCSDERFSAMVLGHPDAPGPA